MGGPVSDPAVAAAARAIALHVGPGTDPENSVEIPPPSNLARADEDGPKRDPYLGTTFDHRFKIESLIGEGGMGFVYAARHKMLGKRVAVKVLRAELARDREIVDRFLQEARAASSIGNAHIIDISDFGDLPDGSTYFVMEFLEGRSLSALADPKNERLPVERIYHVGAQLTDGLAAAHAAGIIHRDLKPDNVFVIARGSDQEFVKILDFGIAKVSNGTNTKLTKAGQVFGTPHYMSPEQAAGSPVDHRTDIYALGVMLYELVSGQLPFNADNFMGILTQHMYKAPVPIRALVPGPECPPSLEAVILKCLSKKPELRYQSMEELGADLERASRGVVPHAVAEMMARSGGFNVPQDYFKHPNAIIPATPHEKRKPWSRNVAIAGAAVAVTLVTTILIVGGSGAGSTPPKAARNEAAVAPALPAPPPVVTPASAPATASASPAPKKATSVSLAAFPEAAMAYLGDRAIKLPARIEVPDGAQVTVDVRAEGYESQTLVLDGKEDLKSVTLKYRGRPSVGGALPRATATAAAASGTKRGGGSEVVDPWK